MSSRRRFERPPPARGAGCVGFTHGARTRWDFLFRVRHWIFLCPERVTSRCQHLGKNNLAKTGEIFGLYIIRCRWSVNAAKTACMALLESARFEHAVKKGHDSIGSTDVQLTTTHVWHGSGNMRVPREHQKTRRYSSKKASGNSQPPMCVLTDCLLWWCKDSAEARNATRQTSIPTQTNGRTSKTSCSSWNTRHTMKARKWNTQE